MDVLHPGEIREAILEEQEQEKIPDAQEYNPLMEEYEHIKSQREDEKAWTEDHVVPGQELDEGESTVVMEATLEEDVQDEEAADVDLEEV